MSEPTTTPEPTSLEVRNLSYSYGSKPVLSEISFSLRRGRFVALLGHNGAGKTTLLSLILRLLQPPAGCVTIEGRELAAQGAAALAPVGIVFQEPTLDLDLTVHQNLAYFGALHGLSGADVRRRMSQTLAALDVEQTSDTRVRTLSGGQRRRIEIARALLHAPRLLLLDEPTVGLDIPTRRAIVDHVHALAAREGVSVLWATHLIDEVRDGDDVVVLHRGRVTAVGAVGAVMAQATAATLADAFAALTRSGPQVSP